jgi:hypothetical protein
MLNSFIRLRRFQNLIFVAFWHCPFSVHLTGFFLPLSRPHAFINNSTVHMKTGPAQSTDETHLCDES